MARDDPKACVRTAQRSYPRDGQRPADCDFQRLCGQNVAGLRQVRGVGLDTRPRRRLRGHGLQADMDSSTQDSATSGGC